MYGSPARSQFAGLLALVLAGFVLPRVLPDYFLYVGNLLMMYAILAIGLDLLLGWAGQFAFAHIAFYGIGIYATALLNMKLGIPFILGMPLAAVLAALIGFLIAVPATRLRTVYLALATFAFAECAQWVFRTWESLTRGPDGLRMSPASILGYTLNNDREAMPVIACITALMIGLTLFLVRSRFGRALAAVRDSEHVASACGIDVRRSKILAFTVSAFFAGVAGGVYTLFQSFVHPDGLGVWTLVLVLTMVVVGGSGSIGGALVGVVLIGTLPELLRAAPRGLLVWQEFAYGLILILAIMFMPAGIWGVLRKRRTR